MANILVWGKTRDLIAGEIPAGIATEEVDSLAAVQAVVAGKGSTLVLADPSHLAAEKPALETWIRAGGNRRALLVAAADAGDADDLIHRFPFLDDVLIKPLTPTRLRLRLDRALDTINSRRVIEQLDDALVRKSQELHELNNIGVALSAQRDIDKLLELILLKCREITASDAGSLYLVERGREHEASADDQLVFELTQNSSVVYPFQKSKMPLSEASISGYAALSGQIINVPDAYHLPAGSPYKVSRSFDEKSGYRTKSMLVVPMRDHQNTVIGVIQLINKKRDPRVVLQPVQLVDEAVIPFTSVDEELVTSLASQAAVAFENTRLILDIKNLFNAFVDASVTAVESRDPTTSGHSKRVATLTVGLAEKVDTLDAGPFREIRFTRDQLQEVRYASLLHDFGKVGVREKVLIKGKKLYVGEMLLIRQRFSLIKRTLEAEHLRAKLEQLQNGPPAADLLLEMDRAYEAQREEVDSFVRMIVQANEPTILEEESVRALVDLTGRSFSDVEGSRQPFLTPNEVAALSIRKGSLSEKERREIESHVTHTFKFLSEIPWTGEFRRVPEIAYAHHEKLDGTGYPRRLKASDIPIQSRMMAIADIFDALVAWDRPYKKAVPVERALGILRDEAGTGKLDRQILDIFIDAKIYEKTLPRAGAEATEIAR
jgi:HD-GYP domain-containing protein (c-di-GMP phosphodiesterase class II)